MMIFALRLIAGALMTLGVSGNPTRTERMIMSQMRMSDLDGSATGYLYDQRPGLPVSYVQYTTHGIGPYVYTDYGQYDDGVDALAPYYPLVHHYEGPHRGVHDDLEPHHGHHRHGEEESYEEGDAAERHSEGNSVQGERGEKGYGAHHDFDKGENENREAEHREGEYKDEAGHKGGHEESNSKYEAHDVGEAGQEGANYGNKAYQKKGHRTSGFHNVYRKDEYKKDTDFYDEDHDGGHYEKYGAFDSHHKDENKGYEKGGKHDSGYEVANRGQGGHYDKGHQHSSRKGHQGAEGEDTYREEHADYDNKAARHKSNQQAFKQGHGYR